MDMTHMKKMKVRMLHFAFHFIFVSFLSPQNNKVQCEGIFLKKY